MGTRLGKKEKDQRGEKELNVAVSVKCLQETSSTQALFCKGSKVIKTDSFLISVSISL